MYRLSDAVRGTPGLNGGFALDLRKGQIFNLNHVGSRIFELLQDGFCRSEIVNTICLEFNGLRDTVELDVSDFLGALRTHGLIVDVLTKDGNVVGELS